MGAPKQKWTSEEEAALKAGILKHGPSKWSAILKDSEFSGLLRLRSNVDLKDKWRNMSVTANGWGSRDRARLALKRNQILKKEGNPLAMTVVDENQNAVLNPTPIAVSTQMLPTTAPKKPIGSFDDVILEAITTLKEPTGSNKTAISMFIEVHYNLPPNFKQTYTIKLAELVESGKLVKVKRKYRLPPSSVSRCNIVDEKKLISECPGERKDAPLPMLIDSGNATPECLAKEEKKATPGHLVREEMKETPKQLAIEEKKDTPAVFENKPLKRSFTKTQVDFDLRKMFSMTEEEAAAAAVKAVIEAEQALAEAEAAAAEAEEAEAYAEELRIALLDEQRRHNHKSKKLKISTNERGRNSGWGA